MDAPRCLGVRPVAVGQDSVWFALVLRGYDGRDLDFCPVVVHDDPLVCSSLVFVETPGSTRIDACARRVGTGSDALTTN